MTPRNALSEVRWAALGLVVLVMMLATALVLLGWALAEGAQEKIVNARAAGHAEGVGDTLAWQGSHTTPACPVLVPPGVARFAPGTIYLRAPFQVLPDGEQRTLQGSQSIIPLDGSFPALQWGAVKEAAR